MSEDKELQKLNTIENTEIDADDDDIEDAEDTIGDSSDVNKFSAAYEKETVINFNNAEQNASCYTLNTHKRQMLLNLAEEYPDDEYDSWEDEHEDDLDDPDEKEDVPGEDR